MRYFTLTGALAATLAMPLVAQTIAIDTTQPWRCEDNAAVCDATPADAAVPDDAIRQPGSLPVIEEPIIGEMDPSTVAQARGVSVLDEQSRQQVLVMGAGTTRPRSTGGRRALAGEARWQAQLYQPWSMQRFAAAGMANGRPLWQLQHLCGAVLIASDWLLTAAHCLRNVDGERRPGYRVRLGVIDFSQDDGWTYMIDRVVRHPDYRDPEPGAPPRTRYDIALIHFVRDGATRSGNPPKELVTPIALDTQEPPEDGELVQATGWGVMAGQRPTPVMMLVAMDVVADERCAGLWRAARNPLVICAGRAGVQTCQGDSGGPLVNARGTPRLIGIVSYNLRECRGDAERPGVYTRVAVPEYQAWIRQTISPSAPPARR